MAGSMTCKQNLDEEIGRGERSFTFQGLQSRASLHVLVPITTAENHTTQL